MATPIPLRTRSLADVPEALRDYYRETDAGEHILDHQPDPARLRLERERDRWRRMAEGQILGTAADQVVDRLGPDPAWRALIRQRVLGRLALDDDGESTPTAIVVDADGKPAQARDGRDMTLDMVGLQAADPEFHATFGRCWGQADSSAKQQRGADADSRDVVVTADASQAEFEAAWRQAAQQGGEVVIGDQARRPGQRSTVDVTVPSGDQAAFEAAYAKAQEQGGNVVIEGAS